MAIDPVCKMQVDEKKMRANLDITKGLIVSEAVMMGLGPYLGRQYAHDLVYDICREVVKTGRPLAELLAENAEIAKHMSKAELMKLCDPANYLGLAPQMVDRVLASVKPFLGVFGLYFLVTRRLAELAGKPIEAGTKEEHLLSLSKALSLPADKPVEKAAEVKGTDDTARTLLGKPKGGRISFRVPLDKQTQFVWGGGRALPLEVESGGIKQSLTFSAEQ